MTRPLDYAGRCARYLPARGVPYDPGRLSVDRLTSRQRRRALKKERHAFPLLPNIDDDPIQCCDPRCDGELHPDPACGGTGLYEHQVIF